MIIQSMEHGLEQIKERGEKQETGSIRVNIEPPSSRLKKKTVSVNQTKQTTASSGDFFIGLVLFFLGVGLILLWLIFSTSYVEKSKELTNGVLPVGPFDTNYLAILVDVKFGTTIVKDSSLKVMAWESERKAFDIYIFDIWNSSYNNLTEIEKCEHDALHVIKNASDVIFKVPIAMKSNLGYYFVIVNPDPEAAKTVNIMVTLEWQESKWSIYTILWLFIFAIIGFFFAVIGLSEIFYPPLADKILRRTKRR